LHRTTIVHLDQTLVSIIEKQSLESRVTTAEGQADVDQLGGIQSTSALPGDPTFNQFNNHYDVASYKRICNEFGINYSSDFRFTQGANQGLGSVYVYAGGATKTDFLYPGSNKFSDEGGKADKGNLIYYIQPDAVAYSQ